MIRGGVNAMMGLDATTLMLSVLFGAIGTGLFMFGKRQERIVHVAAGLALMIVPYFLPGPISLTLVCGAITGLPFFVDL